MIQQYENRCPLLSYAAQTALRERREQRDRHFDELLEAAGELFDEGREERGRATEGHAPEAAEASRRQQIVALRQGIVEAAESAAMEGVQEFADGLLLSQGRLGVHAVLLREYTALLTGEIRDRINASELFQVEPLPPWQQDSIVQGAIHACEEILFERRKIENPQSNDVDELTGNPTRTWSPLVQEWEALKSARKLVTATRERIPESDLRNMIAAQYGGRSEDLTLEEIQQGAFELCRHYHSFLMVPSHQLTVDGKSREAVSQAGAQFWKEREDEFRKYDTPENTLLMATGHDDSWNFLSGPGQEYSIRESLQLFRSLAREAAKGLAGPRSAEPWVDWLNALQHARDKSSGELLYANVSTGSMTIGNRYLKRQEDAGESLPAGGMTEFFLVNDAKSTSLPETSTEAGGNLQVETQLFWDTTSTTIERLFKTSAKYCLELRSLAPHSLLENLAVEPGPGEMNPAATEDAEKNRDIRSSKPRLNVDLISNWMDNEGYDNKELAAMLKISVRTVSSMRNNGNYHGDDAVTKLANRMNLDVENLYLP